MYKNVIINILRIIILFNYILISPFEAVSDWAYFCRKEVVKIYTNKIYSSANVAYFFIMFNTPSVYFSFFLFTEEKLVLHRLKFKHR